MAIRRWRRSTVFLYQRATKLTAENFLVSCLALLQHAAIARDPCAAAALDNGEHKRPAAPGTLWQQRRRVQIPCGNTDYTEEKDPKGRPPERT